MEAELENARKEIVDLQTKLRASEEEKMAMREACNRECQYLQEQLMRLQRAQAESSAVQGFSQMAMSRIRPHDTPSIAAVRKPGL
jgi:hypothetical protein